MFTPLSGEPRWLIWTWTLGLIVLALIHLGPVIGVLGGEVLQRLYGVRAEGADLQLLLRHRAVLFGMAGGILLLAAFNPAYRALALAVGWLNVASFLILAAQSGEINAALSKIQRVDTFALLPLIGLTAAHFFWRVR